LPPQSAARQPLPHGAAQRLDARLFGCKRGAVRKPPLEFQRMCRIQFAVHIGVEQQPIVIRCRHLSAPNIAITRPRARASRDITVPIGTPVIVAISR
jgi:hypothetical protein